tara:strand:- start:1500 stop:2987 length:1488 start_codon:yes stop_codon:yes gene_type:complete
VINKSKKLAGPFLIDLKNKFREIAGDDQLIDREEFQNGLELSNKDISDRLFDIFDKDGSGSIDYNEFMGTIESVIYGDEKEKIRFAFELHDLDNSGYIDREELKILIKQSFIENSLDFDEFQLDLLVEDFFKRADLDHSDTIDFDEFLNVAHDYPDFIEGFAVNPVNWLIPDRYEDALLKANTSSSKKNKPKKSIQVQDISVFKWLLIPRFIFFYNVLMNRKKNRKNVKLESVSLLPSKVLELSVSVSDNFHYKPGDYVYINCKEISSTEWYPFNIIQRNSEGHLVLHVKSNDRWSKELYDKTLRVIEKDAALDWMIRLDGPYGESSESIIDTEHAVLVGAGHGISRIAPILQDIALRLNNDSNKILLKRIDLHWIIEDHVYFEWFTKLLQDINDDSDMFNYHIYFVDKSPDSFNEKLMYIATNAVDKSTKVSLIDNLWDITNFGLPNWSDKLTESRKKFSDLNCSVFYSGPRKYYNALKNSCRELKIPIKKNSF